MPDYEITAPNGRKFVVTAPDGASQDDILKYAQANMPERDTSEQVARGVGLFGKGVNDAVGAGIAAPVEAVNWLLKQPGRAMEAATGMNVPNVLPEGGFYTERAQGALNALGRNDTPENRAERVAYGAGQGAGNAVSFMAPGAAMRAMAPAGSVAQGVGRALTAQPAVQMASGMTSGAVTEATDSPMAGLAAGIAVPAGMSIARGLLSPGATPRTPELQRLTQVAEQEGIPLTAGQATNSRPMRAMESVFSTLPSTAGRQEALTQAQRDAFNKAVLDRSGVRGANLATPDVLKGAQARLGGELQTIAGRNTMTVDAPTMQSVQTLAKDARRYLTGDQAKPMLARIEDFIDKIQITGRGSASVEGAAYAKLDSALATQIRGTNDGNARTALSNLRDALRKAMDNSISPDDAAAWQDARTQYANYKTVQRAMNSPNASTAAGNIPPAALSQALASGPQRNFAMGRGDLNDLTRVGRAFVQDAVPNSGSPERAYLINMLTGGAGAGGALAAGGDLGTAALSAGAMLAGPRVAQEAYLSAPVQAYLRNQLADKLISPVQGDTVKAITAAQAKAAMDRKNKDAR